MTRRTLAKLAAAALALAGGLFLAAWVVLDRLASAPGLKPRIENAASGFLGRPLTIGALEWRRWPRATLVGTDLRLYEDAGRTRVMIESPRAEARLELLSLFKLAAGVTELKFVRPVVRLRRERDGIWNAERAVREIAARPDTPRRKIGALAFNWFAVEGGTLTVEDALGTFARLPPIAVSGRGKLKVGARGASFPFELSGRIAGSPAALALSGTLGRTKTLRASVAGAPPAVLAPFWPAASTWTGRWSASARWDGRPRDWTLDLRAAPLALSTAAAVSELRASLIQKPARQTFELVLRSTGTDLRARGARNERGLDVTVDAPRADLKEVVAWARAAAPPAARPAPAVSSAAARAPPARPRGRPAPRLTARLAARAARWGPLELDGLRATVRRSSGPYEVEDGFFNALGGSVAARGTYDPAGGDGALRLEWTASSIDMRALTELAHSDQDAAGDADSRGHVTTAVGDRFLPAMSGEASVDLRDGWFGEPRGILKVLTHLNIVSLATQLSPRRRRRRVPFNEAHASVRVDHGRATTVRPVVLQNKTLQFVFMGSYDLPARTVDGRVVVHFLTVTDELIRLIPGLRDVLLGKEKGMGTIWLTVKGPADDPDVKVLPAKSIAAPVWNALRRVLRFFGARPHP